MRLPRPSAVRPAYPSGSAASLAVRATALRGSSLIPPSCPTPGRGRTRNIHTRGAWTSPAPAGATARGPETPSATRWRAAARRGGRRRRAPPRRPRGRPARGRRRRGCRRRAGRARRAHVAVGDGHVVGVRDAAVGVDAAQAGRDAGDDERADEGGAVDEAYDEMAGAAPDERVEPVAVHLAHAADQGHVGIRRAAPTTRTPARARRSLAPGEVTDQGHPALGAGDARVGNGRPRATRQPCSRRVVEGREALRSRVDGTTVEQGGQRVLDVRGAGDAAPGGRRTARSGGGSRPVVRRGGRGPAGIPANSSMCGR